LGTGPERFRATRRGGDQKGEDGLSKARRLRLLIGAFLLALGMTLTGCGGESKEEKKKEAEKKEQESKEKKEKEEKK
jgi:hypothetical protein